MYDINNLKAEAIHLLPLDAAGFLFKGKPVEAARVIKAVYHCGLNEAIDLCNIATGVTQQRYITCPDCNGRGSRLETFSKAIPEVFYQGEGER